MSNLKHFQSFAAKDKSIQVDGTNAVIYTRVSDISQQDNTSLESQLKFCTLHAKKRGLNIVQHFGGKYESAKTDDRKEFKRMLKYIKQSGSVSYIIVYSYERFSRSGIGGAKIADDLLKEHGVVTISVTQELDPTTSSGSFQQNILFLFGQMDNELRRNKTITAMAELYRKGFTPRQPPKGYTNLVKGKAVDQKIVVNKEGELLRKAFHWKANKQMGNSDIVRELKKLGLKIDKRRLAEIFANPYYCGLLVSTLIPGEVIEGNHQKMISRELFLKVNNIVSESRKSNPHPLVHREHDQNLPLKVFAKCGKCGSSMTGYQVKAKKLYYYKCKTVGCKHNISAKKVHKQFSALLSVFEVDQSDVPLVKTAIESYYEAVLSESQEKEVLLKKQISQINEKLETLEERFALGEISKELYSKFQAKYNEQVQEIIPNNAEPQIKSSNLKKCLDFALKICLNPLYNWNNSDVYGKMNLQKLIFPDGITIHQQNKGVRTLRVDSLFAPIAEVAKLLKKNKNGQSVDLNQLSALVSPSGFEPETASLEGRCSIQLSYEPIFDTI